MKSISRKDFILAGSVLKSHGTRGEIKAGLDQLIKWTEWAFLEIQGKPVPFYIEQRSGSAEQPILKLRGVKNTEEARLLEGAGVLIPARGRKSRSENLPDVTGFHLIDSRLGDIGSVVELVEMPGQWMLVGERNNAEKDEILVPFVDELVTGVDDEQQTIFLDLPEGMIT